MSGAVRAAWCARTVVGTRCEADSPASAVATPHRAPRAAPTGAGTAIGVMTATVVRRAHVSLVMPTSAATVHVASAAVGQASGSSGAADAGVC
jgi:hypothetical protein